MTNDQIAAYEDGYFDGLELSGVQLDWDGTSEALDYIDGFVDGCSDIDDTATDTPQLRLV